MPRPKKIPKMVKYLCLRDCYHNRKYFHGRKYYEFPETEDPGQHFQKVAPPKEELKKMKKDKKGETEGEALIREEIRKLEIVKKQSKVPNPSLDERIDNLKAELEELKGKEEMETLEIETDGNFGSETPEPKEEDK